MAAVGHLELFLATLDHPRSLLVDRKFVFKFCVDRIYVSEDISDRTFCKFGLKVKTPIPAPKIYVFGILTPKH